jgi:hypothetical protein
MTICCSVNHPDNALDEQCCSTEITHSRQEAQRLGLLGFNDVKCLSRKSSGFLERDLNKGVVFSPSKCKDWALNYRPVAQDKTFSQT